MYRRNRANKGIQMSKTRSVAFLFPGQGAQYPRMAAGLYGRFDEFTATMDEAFELLGEDNGHLRHDWLTRDPETLDDVTRAQPLLYAVDYALGRLLINWGLEPTVMIGHSVGELAAATLSGVFTFADGIRLMRDRMEHFADTKPGGMLAVAAAPDELTRYVAGQVAVAAVNASRQTLLAGTREELASVRSRLEADGFTCKAVKARQAFHSPVVADAAERSIEAWSTVRLSEPVRAIQSTALAGMLTPAAATDPVFWARQPARPVLFWPTLDRLLRSGEFLLIEAGPGRGLSTIARTHPALKTGRSSVIPLLPARPGDDLADLRSIAAAAQGIADEGYDLPAPASAA
jgi:[acyl-carrier-protein] S-malonyltransferase